jgi:hypothetical protein
MDEAPTHLFFTGADQRTLCGIRKSSKDALPYLRAEFLEAHEAGYARRGKVFAVCPECLRMARKADSL